MKRSTFIYLLLFTILITQCAYEVLETPIVRVNPYTDECVGVDDPSYSCTNLPKKYFQSYAIK